MRETPRILVVDDNAVNVDLLHRRLTRHGYEVVTAADGVQALAVVREALPDLVLLDVVMPGMSGIEVCRAIKADAALPFMPVVLVTALADQADVVAGLEAGGDEYLTKPVDHVALIARVRSLLRIKALHDTVQAQAGQLAEWNRTLEARVAAQAGEIERVGRLRRFLPPQLAELVVSGGQEALLDSHRREVAVVFCDLRGFTAFSETAEPEELMEVVRSYHAALGAIVHRFEGTLERFVGDGLVVVFNDPLPCPAPAERAVRMAVAMRESMDGLAARWSSLGHQLGFGVGIAYGYATLGAIGFEGRSDYAVMGAVANLGSRLCAEARPGQILIAARVLSAVEGVFRTEPVGELPLKGFARPVRAFNVLGPVPPVE